MRKSTIAFLVAFLVLVWFGAEGFTGQNICVTGCISLAGMTTWEIAIAVAILPAIIIAYGVNLRRKEGSTLNEETPPAEKAAEAGENEQPPGNGGTR
jgi:hypothetical protein